MARAPGRGAALAALVSAGCGAMLPDGRDASAPGGDAAQQLHFDAACAELVVQARLARGPVDVVFVVDRSSSMSEETPAIERALSERFGPAIAASGADYRVILLARYDEVPGSYPLCIGPPLTDRADCGPASPIPPSSPVFLYYSAPIESRDSLRLLLETYARSDPFHLAPSGWSAWLRPGSFRVFIEVTDDDADLPATTFDTVLLGLGSGAFGDATHREYVFHAITGLRENTPPEAPWPAVKGIVGDTCTGGGVTVGNAGVEHQKLSQLTGGLRAPICEPAAWDAVFQAAIDAALRIVRIPCALDLPPPPGGEALDLRRIRVELAPDLPAGPMVLEQVGGFKQCRAAAFYVRDDKLFLCPDTCSTARAGTRTLLRAHFACLPKAS